MQITNAQPAREIARLQAHIHQTHEGGYKLRKLITDIKTLSNICKVKKLSSARINLSFCALPFALTLLTPMAGLAQAPAAKDTKPFHFHLEEATIDDVHRAIREGQITCHGLVAAYVARAGAYNGVTNELVTADGKDVPAVSGVVRAGAPLKYPTKTVKASDIFPDFDQYTGPPIEFGRMEPTATDPTVYQQYGMTVGMPNVAAVNGLQTLNIRGERSVTCKGDFDTAPSKGPLPAGAPKVCEEFRKLPDALEKAAELDAKYGKKPDLKELPMYCIPFAFKDPYDTMDMHTTGGGDARYDIDFPARDHTIVAELRKKGAIIYAKSVLTEYNGRGGDPGGKNKPTKVLFSTLGYQRSTWGGNPSSVYDSTRAGSLGSSSGSGASVSANLEMCGMCEESRASCRGPANHNSDALILPQKSMISMLGGGIGSDMYVDRAGIHCRSVLDAAKVLDALRDPVNGYYDPRDVMTTVPRSSILDKPYAESAMMSGAPDSLKGVRIGVIRESMLLFPGVKADEPIVEAADKEIKEILGNRLGATLVESVDPDWKAEPGMEQMNPTYSQALAQLVPVIYPELLYRLTRDGKPLFPEFAAAIIPTEFAPGKTFGTGNMKSIDYMEALADGRVPIPKNLNIRAIQQEAESMNFHYMFLNYAQRRAADWKNRGYTETLTDWPTLNARSKFWGDDQRAAFMNWEDVDSMGNLTGERDGIAERAELRELLRRVEMKVIYENHLDVVVRLHSPFPPGKIGMPEVPPPDGDIRGESTYGPNAGLTEVLVPAGYVTTVYDANFKLSADKKRYTAVNTDTPTTVSGPGLPFSLVFRSEPGEENLTLKVAAAYQAASKRRVSPPKFGPIPGEEAILKDASSK
jgi:amidase